MGGAIGKIISEQNQRLLQQIAEGKNPVVGKGGRSVTLPSSFRSVSAPRSPSGPIISRPVQQNLTAEQMYREATGAGIPRRFQGPIGSFPINGIPVIAAQGGGISSLAYGGDPAPIGFANQAFEGMVPGQGTGMSDSVPFSIEGQQPALLSRDEYVLPADVVSQLGDGSSGAGADMLDNFVSRLRQSKYGNSQQPPANGGQMMNNLMRQGGVV
jgi:hypothetical protein